MLNLLLERLLVASGFLLWFSSKVEPARQWQLACQTLLILCGHDNIELGLIS